MCDEVIAVRVEIRLWIFFYSLLHALIHIPVRGIDGYVADPVLAFLEQASDAVTFFGCVSLLEEGIAEQLRALSIGSNDRLIAEKICREFTVRDAGVREH